MIIMTLRINSTSISLIFLPLFSSVMFLSHLTGIALSNMFATIWGIVLYPSRYARFFRTSLQQLSTGKATGLGDL